MVFGQAPAAGSAVDKLLPYGLGVLLVVAVLFWVAKTFFGEWAKKAGDRSFGRLFPGGGRIGGRRLRDYRRTVEAGHGKHVLGFFSTESKHSMLIWAATEPTGRRPHVPVMVDLHRCNTSDATLVDLVVDELHRSRLHRRTDAVTAFVRGALDDGRLRLLFDGLDEVGRDNQDRVVRELRDLARTYPRCQLVVTCRTAAYQGQLAPDFDHVVHVAEFDDASVRRLLGNWPGIDDAGGPDRLFDLLHRNPQLMRLARSPLLLTMMAYLHVEGLAKTGRTLPNSRAEFYDKAITHLLGRDVELGRGRALTVYNVGEKLAALQRVALTLQGVPPGSAADRVSMSRKDLLATIGPVLPELNLDSTHAKNLFDEIVERSQLLIPLDRNDWLYQFRHLTMQEYLAARELAGDPDRLMRHYRADPDAWRETVKLWCANGQDCTAVVREVFGATDPRHQVLALECLAEATRVSSDLADEVINHFLRRLGTSGDTGEAIIHAFGAVAADSRPRGNKVLDLLGGLARNKNSGARGAACRALAASGRTEAAQLLAPLAVHDQPSRTALRDMGELAIPVLAEHAADGRAWAVDLLAEIGTPTAVVPMVEQLWGNHASIAVRAAWRLAELLRNPDIEEALSRMEIDHDTSHYDWVWRPFAANSTPSMARIADRMAHLIDAGPMELVPREAGCIDTRIGLPLAALGIRHHSAAYHSYDERTRKLARPFAEEQGVTVLAEVHDFHVEDAYLRAGTKDTPSPTADALATDLLEKRQVTPRYRRMVELLTWPVRAQLMARVVAVEAVVGKANWIDVLEAPRSSLALWRVSWTAAAALVVGTVGLGGYLTVTATTGSWRFGPQWVAWVATAGFLVVAVSVVVHARKVRRSYTELERMLGRQLVSTRLMRDVFDDDRATYDALTRGSIGVLVYGVGVAVTTAGDWISWTAVGVVLVGVLTPIAAVSAKRRERNRNNALRDCLTADRRSLLGRRSVIAGGAA